MKLWLLLCVLALAFLAVIVAGDGGTIAGLDASSFMGLVTAGSLLIFVGMSVLGGYQGRFSRAAKDLAIWVSIALALVLGYSFREDFKVLAQRVTAELMPPGEAMSVRVGNGAEQAVRIRKRADGHFIARSEVNGANLTLLVDTGATTVVLKPTDARLAGIDIDALTYSVPVRTANGTAYAAAVRIKRMAVGGIVVDGVEALVAKPGALTESLLGMSFLTRLRSYEFSGEFLTLRG